MFKYRVLTFTIILSMLLFYVTPIGAVDVKAEEVEYSQSQLQDVGAWFIGERLLEGAIDNFNFSNLPTDVSADDFLADLGAIIVEGNPDPLINDLGQAADDIWNDIEQEINSWSTEDAWNFAKDFFYTLWYDVPSSPSLPPLVNVFGIAGDVLEASGVDKYLQYVNTDIPTINPDVDYLTILDVINGNGTQILTQYDSNLWIGGYNSNSYVNYENYQHDLGSSSWNGFQVQTSDIISINIFSNNNTYSFTVQSIPVQHCNQTVYYSWAPISYTTIVYNWTDIGVMQQQKNDILTRSWSGTLSQCLYYISNNFKNVNITVDGVPWSIVNITPRNPIASTDLTYPNYEPAKYTYPDDTFVDWNRLYTIIYNAVRDGIVIDFGDLEDCFVDVNGQTAIATLGLIRNDYDNLVDEQFNMVPYPRFNNNIWLTNLADEMTEPAQNGVAIIENAYNIFPLPLQKALLFAGALLLFGLLIRRFLE